MRGEVRAVLALVLVVQACEHIDETPAPPPEATAEGRLIYGADDRREPYQVQDPVQLMVARSTAAVVSTSKLSAVPGGVAVDVSQTFGARYNLCASEPYRDQPSTAFCTAFAVGSDLVATAGHCISASNCATSAFVFGFEMLDAGTVRSQVPADDVYFCAAIVARAETTTDDYAVIRVDRPISGRPALPIRRSGVIPLGAAVGVTGHPAGLPLKIAGGATVRRNDHAFYFQSNLDTYGGNSGSPVFNAADGVVEGILVRGNTDFVSIGKGRSACNVSNQCNDSGCPGWEDVTRAARFAPYVPAAPACQADADCADGNPCNGAEVCNAGRCLPGAAPDCGDGDACTTDRCVALDAVQYACDYTAVSCNDGDPCTADFCDPVTGCGSAPLQCGPGEVCDGGFCVIEPVCAPRGVACAAHAECCSGTCHPKKRTCN